MRRLSSESVMSHRAQLGNMLLSDLRTVPPYTLSLYGLWNDLHEEYSCLSPEVPEVEGALRVLSSWLEGRANDHMTVLRLRRLTEATHA